MWPQVFTTIHKTLAASFDNVHGYAVEVPSFGCPWGYNLCYNKCNFADVPNWDPKDTDARLKAALKVTPLVDIRTYQ